MAFNLTQILNGKIALYDSTFTNALNVDASGNLTANQGAPAALANAWPVKLTDGVHSPSLLNGAPTGTEFAFAVRNIPSGTQTIGGAVTTTAPSYTNGQSSPLSLDTNGALRVNVVSGGAGGSLFVVLADTTASGFVNTVAGSNSSMSTVGYGGLGIQITGTWSGTLTFQATLDGGTWFTVGAIVPITGASVTSTTSNGQWIAGIAGYTKFRVLGPVTTGQAAVTLQATASSQTTSLVASLPTGTNTIGAVTQGGAPWTQNVSQVGGIAISLGQKTMASSIPVVLSSDQSSVAVTGTVTTPVATSGGASVKRLLSTASTNATLVKPAPGQLYGWFLFNASTGTRFLKFHNVSSLPTVGTTPIFMTIPIPAGAGANVWLGSGIAMDTGIAFSLTNGLADTDTGAVGVNEVVVNLFYA